MGRRCPRSRPRCHPGRLFRKICCDDCCRDRDDCCRNECKPKCCPNPCPPPVDCCPKSTPEFALLSFAGSVDPQVCLQSQPQRFMICTSASCNLVGVNVFFQTLIDPAQSDLVTVHFFPPGGGPPLDTPFVNGVSRFPETGFLPLRNGCSEFDIAFSEPGFYDFRTQVIRANDGKVLAEERIGITVIDCTPIS